MDARNAGRHGMDAEEVILDARCYAEYVKSMDRWGHGPVQVAGEIVRALNGEGLPEDCLGWLKRMTDTPEGRAWLDSVGLGGMVVREARG